MKFLENSLVDSNTFIKPQLPFMPGLVAGVSLRQHSNMRLGPNGAPIDSIARACFALEIGASPERVVCPILVHGNEVARVSGSDLENALEVDGLVTDEPGLFLSVTAADCAPVFFIDTEKRIVGIAHAGWRGLLRGVIQSVVNEMKAMGSDTGKIHAFVGPVIGVCHFEVGMQVAEQFRVHLGTDVLSRREGKIFVDLKKSAQRLLGRAGVSPGNIKTSEICTFCDERCFSSRRDGADGLQTMVGIIGIE